MVYLLDTGILFRFLSRSAPDHQSVRTAMRILTLRGHSFTTSSQNIGEFWNVSTRPVTARGGHGLPPLETDRRVRLIERAFQVLPDSSKVYPIWRELIVAHNVIGVQVHDARLAAIMRANGLTQLLTLNPSDFKRYSDIIAETPAQVLAKP